MLAEVLRGLDTSRVAAVACGVGPGPYTGLRVGIASALAVGAAWGLPVMGLCSLDAVAAAAGTRSGPFGVAADARRSEVYWAWYASDGSRTLGPLVSRPDEIDDELRRGPWLGGGALAHRDLLDIDPRADGEADGGLVFPHASWVGRRVGDLRTRGTVIADDIATLSAHGGDGSPTSNALSGAALLPPRPLYLRRPDAIEVAAR
jgi:tRNA threonylcarbamoyl adenosine modification protein YeaZ